MREFFNEIDNMQNGTDIGGMIVDDRGDETKNIYENGKAIYLPRGIESEKRILIHSYIKTYLEKYG